MSVTDQLLTPIPGNDDNTRLTLVEQQLKVLLAMGTGDAVGDWKLVRYPPPGWDSGNLVLVGKYAVPNGFAVLKADFPDLDETAASAGYPDGSDATHVNLPDALGRSLVVVGTHTDVTIGQDDGQTLPNRTVKHNTSGGSLSGVPGVGTLAISPNPHTHSGNDYWRGGSPAIQNGTYFSANASSTIPTTSLSLVGALDRGTLSVGAIGPGGSRPTDMPSYIVVGMLLLRVLP